MRANRMDAGSDDDGRCGRLVEEMVDWAWYLEFRSSFLSFRCVSRRCRGLAEVAASEVLGRAGFRVVSDQLRHSSNDFVAVLVSHHRAVRAISERWARAETPRGIEGYAFRCELFRGTTGLGEMPLHVAGRQYAEDPAGVLQRNIFVTRLMGFQDTYVLWCEVDEPPDQVRARVFCEVVDGDGRALLFDSDVVDREELNISEFGVQGPQDELFHLGDVDEQRRGGFWFLEAVNERYPAWKRSRFVGRDDPYKFHGRHAVVRAAFHDGKLQFAFLMRSADCQYTGYTPLRQETILYLLGRDFVFSVASGEPPSEVALPTATKALSDFHFTLQLANPHDEDIVIVLPCDECAVVPVESWRHPDDEDDEDDEVDLGNAVTLRTATVDAAQIRHIQANYQNCTFSVFALDKATNKSAVIWEANGGSCSTSYDTTLPIDEDLLLWRGSCGWMDFESDDWYSGTGYAQLIGQKAKLEPVEEDFVETSFMARGCLRFRFFCDHWDGGGASDDHTYLDESDVRVLLEHDIHFQPTTPLP